jgi:hypothetical protein
VLVETVPLQSLNEVFANNVLLVVFHGGYPFKSSGADFAAQGINPICWDAKRSDIERRRNKHLGIKKGFYSSNVWLSNQAMNSSGISSQASLMTQGYSFATNDPCDLIAIPGTNSFSDYIRRIDLRQFTDDPHRVHR